jgi:hypothetical protein
LQSAESCSQKKAGVGIMVFSTPKSKVELLDACLPAWFPNLNDQNRLRTGIDARIANGFIYCFSFSKSG